MMESDIEIIEINCDTYTALYVNGELSAWSDTYNFDFQYGVEIAQNYPGAHYEKKFEEDLEESCRELFYEDCPPKYYKDVVWK